MYNPCWAYAEQILSHTEHTRNEFHRMLSIRRTDFIACWACAEMFKSQISRPNRIRFSKISCYRPLGPYGFGFCKKSQKKISCLCTFKVEALWAEFWNKRQKLLAKRWQTLEKYFILGKKSNKILKWHLLTVLLVLYFKRLGSKTFAHAQNVLCTETAASTRQPSILRSSGSDTTRSGGTITSIVYCLSMLW